MPTNNDDLLKKIQDAQKSGQDMDPGIMPSTRSKPHTINIDGKDVEVKPVPMPMPNVDKMPKTANRPDDLVYRYAPGQGPNFSDFKRGMKNGGKINLKDCEIRTAEGKNSKLKNCW
jgi:hypothetical protein